MGAVHVLGRTATNTPWVLTGLALAAGLQYLGDIQLVAHNRCGLVQQGKRLLIYTDYPPLHSGDQVDRLRIYGAPEQSTPEHEVIDSIL